jgi:hypothetical protein
VFTIFFTDCLVSVAQKWELLDPRGERPLPRAGHTMVSVGTRLFVCGGYHIISEISSDASQILLGNQISVYDIGMTQSTLHPS